MQVPHTHSGVGEPPRRQRRPAAVRGPGLARQHGQRAAGRLRCAAPSGCRLVRAPGASAHPPCSREGSRLARAHPAPPCGCRARPRGLLSPAHLACALRTSVWAPGPAAPSRRARAGCREAGRVVGIDACVQRRPPAAKLDREDDAVDRLAQLVRHCSGVLPHSLHSTFPGHWPWPWTACCSRSLFFPRSSSRPRFSVLGWE